MADLPVREMVLYKHGVGFFRREGEVSGEEVTLTFREDSINDILKSLAAFDRQGGQILGIHYQTPMDKAARLAESSIRLSHEASLIDLLKSLRGRVVELDEDGRRIKGRLIGVDVESEERIERSLVNLIDDADGQVRVFRLKDLRGVRIIDERAGHDLHYFLDTSMREDIRRQVTLRLSKGKHQLVVYYVAPSPTWRVSYRFVAEMDDQAETGKALLQGWGLFDNRLDEDLVEVKVTLVAGQPISFIYDLYASRIPERPVIEDEARVAPGPIDYLAAPRPRLSPKAEATREMVLDGSASPWQGMVAAGIPAAAPAMANEADMRMADLNAAVAPAAEGEEAGEFFRYAVTTPVTVKRGESALVPIIGTEVTYHKELLYNRIKLPDHPVAAIQFENTTGLTLERGPVTVVEDGEYIGEAVVPFTKTDNDVYLPYAVELGVKVVEQHRQHREMAGLDLQGRYMIVNEYEINTTIYSLDNTTDRDLTITIEKTGLNPHWELFDTPAPDVETATHRRWKIPVEAHDKAAFQCKERQLMRRREEVRRLDYRRLQQFMKDRWLDQSAFELLAGLLDNLAFIQQAQQEQAALQQEIQAIYMRQGQLRENLNTLKPSGEEAALRSRVLRQLESSEDRIEGIDLRLNELSNQIAGAEAQIEETLRLLGE